MTTGGVFAVLDCLLSFRIVSSKSNIDKSKFEVQLMQEPTVGKQARKYEQHLTEKFINWLLVSGGETVQTLGEGASNGVLHAPLH